MKDIIWQKSWRPINSAAEVADLQSVLEKELTSAHPMYAYEPKVVGRCRANDDVVFVLSDGRLSVLHLAWSGRPDKHPDKYPAVSFLGSVEEFNAAIESADQDDF
jgi:hypothetical protein